MKASIHKTIFWFFTFLYTFFFLHDFFPFFNRLERKSVYINTHYFGWLGERKNHPGSPIYGYHLPTIFKKYQLRIKTARHLRKRLKDLNKLIVFNIEPPGKTKYYKRFPSHRMVLFLWEPPTVFPMNFDKKFHKYFSKIYTWDDSLVDGKKYFKFYYPELQDFVPSKKKFYEKKLCALITKSRTSPHPYELYSERKKVIRFFEENAPEDFDLYGQGWNRKERPSYLGEVPSKECLHNYRFCICYENLKNVRGYITEKIFDAFHFGCVPIYLGAENITDYIPKTCFIDRRDFVSEKQLYEFLKNMNEDTYNGYLKNIEAFLLSDRAKVFSKENFLKIFKEAVGVK